MTWNTIKNFGQIKYLNISYVVLIIVPILANTFQILKEEFCYDVFIPPMVKSLYLASLIYGIAIAIYQYKCPEIIKDYKNLQDYIDQNLHQMENIAPDLRYNIVLAHLAPTQYEIKDVIVDLKSKIMNSSNEEEISKYQNLLDSKLNLVYSSCVQSHLVKKYEDDNTKTKWWRWIAGILYIIGSLILIILLVIRTFIVFNN